MVVDLSKSLLRMYLLLTSAKFWGDRALKDKAFKKFKPPAICVQDTGIQILWKFLQAPPVWVLEKNHSGYPFTMVFIGFAVLQRLSVWSSRSIAAHIVVTPAISFDSYSLSTIGNEWRLRSTTIIREQYVSKMKSSMWAGCFHDFQSICRRYTPWGLHYLSWFLCFFLFVVFLFIRG